jgi:hypothetical protein
MIAIFLKKSEKVQWGCVTEKELKAKEKSMPKLDENADPQEGTNLLNFFNLNHASFSYDQSNLNLKV